ncbi:MAG: anthranilate synthase component I family protein [Pyrinomonadaceae bacterium]
MHQLSITADDLVRALLRLSQYNSVCILDSSGVGHLGSHLLIAGIEPIEVLEVGSDDPSETLKLLDKKLAGDRAAIFTISYEFGQKMAGLESRREESADRTEPDVYLALFETLIVHDYTSGETKLVGNRDTFEHLGAELTKPSGLDTIEVGSTVEVSSNFTKAGYLAAIETIKEHIRDGDTYQTNLTQQLTAELPDGLTPEIVFERLRRDHPAPFAAFIKRADSAVVSASPERFFRVSRHVARRDSTEIAARRIETSPIKGTRHRGRTPPEDELLRKDLLASAKDRAENTMIVDLLRNDLGRVCEFGTVRVEKLCDLEEHPTLFHLVSTISGDLRAGAKFSDILRAVFPCGSITGAPKISTMKIIDRIEAADRGLSMGAIGYYVPESWNTDLAIYDLSVAIRTMVIRGHIATFNVGGGITIDSDPDAEYDETLLKSKALLRALTQ